MPTPLAEGQENSFAPQMIFLWPPARGVGKILTSLQSLHHNSVLRDAVHTTPISAVHVMGRCTPMWEIPTTQVCIASV